MAEPLSEATIEKFNPEEGDILLIQTSNRLDRDAFERIKSILKERYPDVRWLLFESGLTATVVKSSDFNGGTDA